MGKKTECKKKRHSNPNAKFNTERNKRLRAERLAREMLRATDITTPHGTARQKKRLGANPQLTKPKPRVWFEPPAWKLALRQLRGLV